MGRWTPPPTDDPITQAQREAAAAVAARDEAVLQKELAQRKQRKAEKAQEDLHKEVEFLRQRVSLRELDLQATEKRAKFAAESRYAAEAFIDDLIQRLGDELFPERDRYDEDQLQFEEWEHQQWARLNQLTDTYAGKTRPGDVTPINPTLGGEPQ